MVNINTWISLSEKEYAALMLEYKDELAMKFAINRIVRKFIEEKSSEIVIAHMKPEASEEIA